MRRVPGVLAALVLAVAVVLAAPAASGAPPSAVPSAKHRCKHKAKHHRKRKKRCRKKANGTTSPTEEPGAPSGPPGRLLATERELSLTQLQLQLSRARLAAGTTIVEQYNAGSDPHNLIFERNRAVAFSFPTLDPGLNQRQTLSLGRGTWTLYCSILDHKDLGMQATLSVY
jgi:plastocyanin